MHRHAFGMFVITEADAVAIRAIFSQEGELSAAIELRRRFPGITDNAKARAHVRTIAGWKPLPSPPCSVIRLRPRGESRGEFHWPPAPKTPATEPRPESRPNATPASRASGQGPD
jgi:hypothetical protein